MPNWSPQQSNALKAASKWLRNPGNQQWFYLGGYAGTGKSTLAIHLAQGIDGDVLFGAFTGKAALVLRSKGCDDATTLHRMIYTFDFSSGKMEFVVNEYSPAASASLIVVDEVSMVGADLAKDLLSFGRPVLVLGDPAQLPPVEGAGFFTNREPDCMLTEVHRQAEDNPIIAMSMKVRCGERLEPGFYGESKVITAAFVNRDEVLQADQLLVGRNVTRQRYNARVRELLGHKGDVPATGERLVCLKNNHRVGLLNGQTWRVDDADLETKVRVRLNIFDEMTDQHVETLAHIADFRGEKPKYDPRQKSKFDRFDFGYALTVHKSQGSQWDNVYLFDESGAFRDDRARWLYTGLTRAAEKITVVI